jgi:hypothetical protein
MRRIHVFVLATLIATLSLAHAHTVTASAALPLQLLNPYHPSRQSISTVTKAKHEVVWNGYGMDIAVPGAPPTAVFWHGYFSDGSNAPVDVTNISSWNLCDVNGNYVLTQYSVQLKYVYADGAVAQIEFWHLDVPSVSAGQRINSGTWIGTESNAPTQDLYYCGGGLASTAKHVHVQVYASWGQPACFVTTGNCTTLTWDRWPVGTWEWNH